MAGGGLISSRSTIFAVAVAIALGLFFGLREGVIGSEDKINILVMGIDTQYGWQARSDSLNLVHIDFIRNRIGILAIPRDTLVDIPGHGRDKINHAHMFGGPELSCLTVSRYLKIPVKYYIEVNFPLFMQMVDDLGGVTVDVEKPIYYNDYAANLHINLQPGVQRLSGYQAMGYARFRHDRASDWGRIDRQHRFFQAIAQQLISPSNYYRLPSLLHSAASNIRTNLGTSQTMKIAFRVPGIYRTGNIVMGVIPGTDAMLQGGYYMLPDEKGKREVIDKVIYGK
ncbi:MAG: LCP family protein [Candidatus Margulisiibacteriota bacterium]